MKARKLSIEDWASFCGATGWSDTEAPVCRDITDNRLAVCFSRMIGLYDHHPDADRDSDWSLYMDVPNQMIGLAILDGLPETFDPAAYGFKHLTSFLPGCTTEVNNT